MQFIIKAFQRMDKDVNTYTCLFKVLVKNT